MPPSPKPPKPHPFTEEQIRAKAYALWEQRGEDSTDAENWADAIRALRRERAISRVTKPLRGLWQWTGLQEKKGWDIVTGLSIPLVLFLGGQYFTSQNNEKQQQLADDKAKQDTLVKYLDQMADSLQHGLLKAKPGEDQFIVAQSRTVLALQSLDKKRRNLVIQFLSASGLNDHPDRGWQPFDKQGQPKPLPARTRVLLYGAQLSKANLVNSDLSGAVLIGANLRLSNFGCNPPESQNRDQCSDLDEADLRGADLWGTDFSSANLNDANFESDDLSFADLGSTRLMLANLSGADLYHANLTDAFLSSTNLKGTDLHSAVLEIAVLVHTDLRQTRNLTPQQLEGENPPYLCNVALPKGFTVNPNRDCDRLPQVLVEGFSATFRNLKDAGDYVNYQRQRKWPDEPPGK